MQPVVVYVCLLWSICSFQAHSIAGFAQSSFIRGSTKRFRRRRYYTLKLQTKSDEGLDAEINTTAISSVKLNVDKDVLSQLNSCRSRTRANRILSQALSTDSDNVVNKRLYNSISIPPNLSTRPISDAELALQTRTIQSKYKIYELIEQNGDRDVDRASLAVLCTFLAGATFAILAQQTSDISFFGASIHIPDIIRFVIVWILSFSPLILVGYGLAVPDNLSAALVTVQRAVFPSYRKRMIQHEAGHFLIGHLLGWPVKSYQVGNAVKNAVEFYPLSDADAGKDKAQSLGFNVKTDNSSQEDDNDLVIIDERPYFSREGQGGNQVERSVFRNEMSSNTYELASKDDPKTSWPFRGFDDATLDKLAVISVAGACSEILAYGNAEGGVADLIQLRGIYGAAASAEKKKANAEGTLGTFSDDATERRLQRGGAIQSKDKSGSNIGMDEREMDNRTKFALGFAMVLLRSNLGALDALAEVMEQGGSVADCIVAIEMCPNASGSSLRGDHDKIRREKFRADESQLGKLIEKTFLGGGKNIDADDSGVIEGKGGGDREKGFELLGDDPFYAAIAVALAFAAWASSGGLTLH
eukprot:scaffold53708_cov61-Cyclotella_meneghiniana.AAC.5